MSKIRLFNIDFDNINYTEFSKVLEEKIRSRKPSYIVTCNVDHIMKVQKDSSFKKVYDQADVVVADGVPVIWASKLLKKPLIEKISGSDILIRLGNFLEEKQYKLFFLGAAEGVVEEAVINIKKKFPNIQIVGTYSPSYGFERKQQENDHILNLIKLSQPDILLVGVGTPKQEKWIQNNYQKYNVPISIGVGATFDFLAGNVKRAPVFMQKTGLEWFWRLIQEPRRLWKRYLIDDSQFILLILKEIMSK